MNQQPIPVNSDSSRALDDAVIVNRVLDGETALFEILMRRYNQRVYRTVRGILGNAADAEDVTQDAYVRAFHKLSTFRGEAAFSTWLTKIAVYEALSRRRRPRLLSLDDVEKRVPEPADQLTPERQASNLELSIALDDAVDALPAPLRPVFVLREVEGLSTEATATALEITPANVRVRLHRAKEMLRRDIDRQLGSEVRRLYAFDGARCDRLVVAVFHRLQSLRG